MKKSIYTIFVIAGLSSQAISQNKSITFEHASFKEIKAKALKENKLIFIDAYTTWCGPCKQMAKSVFTNDTVSEYYNKNFINAKIDMEKGEGLDIAKQYEVQCYPNLLFIDGNGNLVHRVAGFMSSKAFVALGEDTKNPEKCFSNYSKNYETNKKKSDFLAKYIEARSGTCLESNELVKEYFLLQDENDLTNAVNWEMIKNHINSAETKEFAYLIYNKDKFEKLYSAKEVNEKIDNVNKNTLFTVIRKMPFDEKAYNDAKAKITSLNLPSTKLIFFEADLSLASKKADWITYSKLAVNNVDLFYLNDANMLNNVSWTFYESVNDKEALIKAESWAKKACSLENNYPNLDTYAAVLYKIGKKELALEIANNAIDFAKKENYAPEDYKATVDLMKKIKELK